MTWEHQKRIIHSDGFVGITLNHDKSGIVTCGSDMDWRTWKDFHDTCPEEGSLTEGCTALAVYKDVVYVGTDCHKIESFSLKTQEKLQTVGRFKGEVTDLTLSNDGKLLAAGSSDMTIQVIELEESNLAMKSIDAHQAPVLSVLMDPLGEYVISSGCDGSVVVWKVANDLVMVKQWSGLYAPSNDFSISTTLCRGFWQKDGKYFAIPFGNKVTFYERDTWEGVKTYECGKNHSKDLSVACLSHNGKMLASCSSGGTVTVWNVESQKVLHEVAVTKEHIVGVTFWKDDRSLYMTDIGGNLIMMEETEASTNIASASSVKSIEKDMDLDELEDLHEDFNSDMSDNEISISKIKADAGFIEDEYVGLSAKSKKAKTDLGSGDESEHPSDMLEGKLGKDVEGSTMPTIIEKKIYIENPAPITEPQNSFQPGATPISDEHRFMMWNNTGIIRCYPIENEEVGAIDVEFHDVSLHSGIHLRNHQDYVLATLSPEVVVFGSKKTKKYQSKLFCLNFSSWDSNKEWSVDLPYTEELIGIAIGFDFIVAATSLNRLRFFSFGGAQRLLLSISGQIVAVAAFQDIVFVAYHSGIGMYGNQCIDCTLLKIKTSKSFVLADSLRLPLTPKSYLTWIGFTDEGTPIFQDSKQSIHYLVGRLWSIFCSTENLQSSEKDHFWLTGASEMSQNVRVIHCKGTNFPAALPRPIIMLVEAKMPLCEMDSEKSKLEDTLIRLKSMEATIVKMEKKGFDVDEYKENCSKELKEALLKLFVLSCKSDRDFRALEYAKMMPSSHAVQVAIKYATRSRKMALAGRLNSIGRLKQEEQNDDSASDNDDFENVKSTCVVYKKSNFSASEDLSQDIFATSKFTGKTSGGIVVPPEDNPLLSRQKDEIREILSPGIFKKTGIFNKETKENDTIQSSNSAISSIDAWTKVADKSTADDFNPKAVRARRSKGSNKKENNENKKPESSKASKNSISSMFGKMGSSKSNESMTGDTSEKNDTDTPTIEVDLPEAVEESEGADYETGRKRKLSEIESCTNDTPTEGDSKKNRFAAKLSIFSK